MEATPINRSAVNQSAPAPLQPLVLGFLGGVIPLGLTAAYLLVSALIGTFGTLLFDVFEWTYLLLGLYGVTWAVAILMLALSTKQSHRSFTKGMMIELAASVGMVSLAFFGVILWVLVSLANCHGCLQ